jgi:hypothetical protein
MDTQLRVVVLLFSAVLAALLIVLWMHSYRWDLPVISFLVILSAASPWLNHYFSLRALFVATTLFAAILGLGAWMAS